MPLTCFTMESKSTATSADSDSIVKHSVSSRNLEEHFRPYKKSWSLGKFAVHTHSCDISQICVNALIELSDEMDDGDSCVTRGVESRISKHHLDKFVEIVGQSVPAKHVMTKEEKQKQIAKLDDFKAYVLDNQHRIFPRGNKA